MKKKGLYFVWINVFAMVALFRESIELIDENDRIETYEKLCFLTLSCSLCSLNSSETKTNISNI